jgi:hypothetical protein
MSITEYMQFQNNLIDLCDHEQMMYKPEYQFSPITTNHFLSASDIMILDRVRTTLQDVCNALMNTPHTWTEIYKHLVGIEDTCRLRLTQEYWNKFEACLHYVRSKLPESIPELLAAFQIHIPNFN